MSRIDLHPDHLLARRRAGRLTPEESALLDRHASGCATCAFEIAAAQDFDRDLAAPVDPAALAAITAGVQRRLDEAAAPAPPRRASRRLLVGLAAAAVAAATAFAASLGADRPAPRVATRPRPAHAATPPRPAAAPAPDVAPAPVVAPAAPAAPAPAASAAVPAPADAGARRRHRRAARAVAPPADDGARALFEQAVAARRAGQHALAASLFERLQHRYGDSEEASISQIALGRLWLDRLGQPARALAQFESYLASRRRGESREEAMVGRASALERLGRTASAREAWEAVRDAFPGSASARRAALRIDALR